MPKATKYITYTAIIPATNNYSSMCYHVGKGRETIRQEALWHYNSSLERDGLSSRKRLPAGTKFVRNK